MYLFQSARLGFRTWQAADVAAMTAINADEQVMRYFPKLGDEQSSLDFIKRMQAQQEQHGFCYFAVEILDSQEFIGFIGLAYQEFEHPEAPFVDIGWRLSAKSWGKGLATEGAKACLDFAFYQLRLEKIYAVAPLINQPSINVMEKIGMQHIDTFDHPLLLNDDRLRSCVLYKIEKTTSV